VRRSKHEVSEMAWQRRFLSPYRCRDCNTRFLGLSTKIYYLSAVAGLAIVAGTLGWHATAILERPRPSPELAASTLKTIADTTKLAEEKDPLAEYALAQMYARGDGVPKNKLEAGTWLERAAEHGSSEAQYDIGMALREGRDVVQDYEGALKWLQLAAENDNPRAQFELGHMYRVGMGIPVDVVKAYTWFNLAAARGNTDADRARTAVLPLLSRSEVIEAQREARRWSEARAKQSTQ
jgi:TPR repeat protein